MFPSILYKQIEIGLKDFIKTTYPVSTPFFRGIIDRMFSENEILKGPYISLKLPFKSGELNLDYFENLKMEYKPYLHQQIAFDRLSYEKSRSTLISTGTGSGKTECFLYPILNYCAEKFKENEKGIKAIIIYPMNALATDQAKRFAKTVWRNSNLKNKVRVGLYVGAEDETPVSFMTATKVITDKKTIQQDPPDILLTNYKMLDYMLVRPADYPLWQRNNPATLKYLVVDELHTFDGAQGTDLACLIRRLKSRLRTKEDYLCCVGTSATLGGNNNEDDLLEYAKQIFGEKFEQNSIIKESVLSYNEYFKDIDPEIDEIYSNIPMLEDRKKIDASNYSNVEDYIEAIFSVWFEEVIKYEDLIVLLPDKLKHHNFFRKLVLILGTKTKSVKEIIEKLSKFQPELDTFDDTYKTELMMSMLALVSTAKLGNNRPFLSLRVQYWIRELRRLVADIKIEPNLSFSDDLTKEKLAKNLPAIHCRECGAMGWGATQKSGETALNPDLKQFYNAFFHNSNNVKYIFPIDEKSPGFAYQPIKLLCGNCLCLSNDANSDICPECGTRDKLIKVQLPDNHKKINKKNGESAIISTHDCPYCDGKNSLTIIGSRASSLISIIISQLFASTYNEDKKLLTFSDSVQDASHRAGFFSARTYKFNFRAALQQVVDSFPKVTTLPDICDKFISYYWEKFGQVKFISTFIPQEMMWLDDYETFKNTGTIPNDSLLLHNIKKRIRWEIVSEYGFNSRIGRTLEKAGASTLVSNPELMANIAKELLEVLRNIGGLRNLELIQVNRFLNGILYRLKSGGGIYSDSILAYINSYGATSLLNTTQYMPMFGKNSRAPRFITSYNKSRFDKLFGSGKTSWYEQWSIKNFGELDSLLESSTNDILRETFNSLVKNKILRVDYIKGHSIWSLKQENLFLDREVKQFRCNKCGYQISVAANAMENWNNSSCLRYNCHGKYQLEAEENNYYRKLYKTADIQRIYAEEHTGLLDRKVREKVETSFIKQDKALNPNLLSCTPTLEMGIDIGDLSSLILCSIPPTTSSYLQRIGRSGRRDGNSLNIAVANARPHDLYFFEEPQEILSGAVTTPGCLLNAPAILERQFTAFCFDRWIEKGISILELPNTLAPILAHLEGKSIRSFPFNFTHFVQKNQEDLFMRFIDIFKDDINDKSREELHGYLFSNKESTKSLSYKIHNSFWEIKKEVDSLKKRVRKISAEIRKRKSSVVQDSNYASELVELKNQKDSLNKIIKHIRAKNVFNFFTDEGLLPNYAFPQAGIILRSVILKKKKDADEKGRFKAEIFEYNRPSSMAIKELAPNNKFYAEGRKVTIDQIDLEQSEMEEWIFCDNCSHMETALYNNSDVCPKCGSTLWSDPGQKRKMIKMKQVIATTFDKESRSWDESEDREPEFYNRKIIASIDNENISHAFQLKDQPFGFEFIKKANFREVNFGNAQSLGQMMYIAGREVPINGFKICEACGKVHTQNEDMKHDITCKYRANNKLEEIIDSAFLYREFQSEAIRILLPITSEAISDEKMHTFIAGLYLGLKLKFKGNIDHLNTSIQEMPDATDKSIKKNYLVLYDTVPGGTGYLKELMISPAELIDVFKLAIDTLKSCRCNANPDKDGCYHCIYAYRYNYQKPNISRDLAITLFEDIVKFKDNLITIKSIDEISTNSLLESELEKHFIYKLYQSSPKRFDIKKEIVHEKPGWFLKINNFGYDIEPQVKLGTKEGVLIPARADFIFYPVKESSTIKPIVVFTDGFMFHADPHNAPGQLGKDLAQRMAIIRSGRYLVWSLSWDDLKNHENSNKEATNLISPNLKILSKIMNNLNSAEKFTSFKYMYKQNSFDMLLNFLGNPNITMYQQYSTALLLSQLTAKNVTSINSIEDYRDNLLNQLEVQDIDFSKTGHLRYNLDTLRYPSGKNILTSFIYLEKPVTSPKDLFEINLIARIFDDDVKDEISWKTYWNDFLHYTNIFQFCKNTIFLSTNGIAEGSYAKLDLHSNIEPFLKSDMNRELADICVLIEDKFHIILYRIYKENLELPEIGFELIKDKAIVGQAEIAWPINKVAMLHNDDIPFENSFIEMGWKVFRLENFLLDFEPNINELIKILSKQEII